MALVNPHQQRIEINPIVSNKSRKEKNNKME